MSVTLDVYFLALDALLCGHSTAGGNCVVSRPLIRARRLSLILIHFDVYDSFIGCRGHINVGFSLFDCLNVLVNVLVFLAVHAHSLLLKRMLEELIRVAVVQLREVTDPQLV